MKEGRKPEYLEKTTEDELQKMPHTKARKFKPQVRLELAQYYWLKPLTNEGEKETGVPRRNSWRRALEKYHILQPENSSPKRDSNPHSSTGGRQGKQTCQPLHHASPHVYTMFQPVK